MLVAGCDTHPVISNENVHCVGEFFETESVRCVVSDSPFVLACFLLPHPELFDKIRLRLRKLAIVEKFARSLKCRTIDELCRRRFDVEFECRA